MYDTLDKCGAFESVKNKLYYDMEIEPIYLVGEFAVHSSEEFVPCEGDGYKTFGKFSLTKRPFHINDGDIAPQGFPFFCGSMTLKKTFNISSDEISGKSIEFSRLPSVVTKIKVNGKEVPPMYWAPYTINLDGLLKEGENKIEIELITSFQNMLGTHHLGCNPKCSSPSHFHSKRSRIWGNKNNDRWDEESYSFSGIGIFLK